jgi:inosine-uridine nucleoside N-ribohydrolase
VALAVRQDPTFLTKLKQLVIMGGTVEGKYTRLL